MRWLGLAAAHKYSGAQARRKVGRIIDFEVDPRAPQGVRTGAGIRARCLAKAGKKRKSTRRLGRVQAKAAASQKKSSTAPRPGDDDAIRSKLATGQERLCVTSTC
jgi:hypothetical protein